MNDKSALRTHYLGLLKNQSAHDRQVKSDFIAEKLRQNPYYSKAKVVMFYAAMSYEVDTFGMMRKAMEDGKRVCLPIVETNQKVLIPVIMNSLEELKPSTYGILEPTFNPANTVDITTIDTVIVPGLAFDQAKHRLGRGAGYYDRFLSRLPITTSTLGVAFDFQLLDCLPRETHDMHLSDVIAN